MSTKQAVTIVSRALAVYLLFWFLSDLTYLPSDLFSLWHHQNMLGARQIGQDTCATLIASRCPSACFAW